MSSRLVACVEAVAPAQMRVACGSAPSRPGLSFRHHGECCDGLTRTPNEVNARFELLFLTPLGPGSVVPMGLESHLIPDDIDLTPRRDGSVSTCPTQLADRTPGAMS